MARGWRTITVLVVVVLGVGLGAASFVEPRKAAGPASYWLVLSLIVFVGITAVVKIEATRTRLALITELRAD